MIGAPSADQALELGRREHRPLPTRGRIDEGDDQLTNSAL
jgi:hypothetical protein